MNDPHNHLKGVRALIAKGFSFFPPKDPAGYDSSGEYVGIQRWVLRPNKAAFKMEAPRPQIKRHRGVTQGPYGNIHLVVGDVACSV